MGYRSRFWTFGFQHSSSSRGLAPTEPHPLLDRLARAIGYLDRVGIYAKLTGQLDARVA